MTHSSVYRKKYKASCYTITKRVLQGLPHSRLKLSLESQPLLVEHHLQLTDLIFLFFLMK